MLPRSDREVEPPEQVLPADLWDCAREGIDEPQRDMVDLLGDRLMDEVPGQTVGMIHQPDEIDAAVIGRRRKAYHRCYQRAHDRVGLERPALGGDLAIVERLEPLLVEDCEQATIHLTDQLFFAAEMIVDRRVVDGGLDRDVAQRHGVDAVLCEQPRRRLKNAVLGAAGRLPDCGRGPHDTFRLVAAFSVEWPHVKKFGDP